jgi:hypothetical protein
MIRDLLKKVFRRSSKKPNEPVEEVRGEWREMGEVRAEALEQAEELTPGHANRAGSIGVF